MPVPRRSPSRSAASRGMGIVASAPSPPTRLSHRLRPYTYCRGQPEVQKSLGPYLQVLLAGCRDDRARDSSDHRKNGASRLMGPRPAGTESTRASRTVRGAVQQCALPHTACPDGSAPPRTAATPVRILTAPSSVWFSHSGCRSTTQAAGCRTNDPQRPAWKRAPLVVCAHVQLAHSLRRLDRPRRRNHGGLRGQDRRRTPGAVRIDNDQQRAGTPAGGADHRPP